ncbi:UbiA family prenyltransferase [Defluviimonas sp. WL0002]|uniref:UbiA family prenyltransferase n=1 Tax=Albidovulum marisflavi TaxID=2984159 RepID=A0ABT2ZAD5_9RHOB|nr:UbiA family prenyltransferase [Defluviimonas sp. WL0002]MCV2868038.1 UbiA family prenyltransferase [Defluviimonas sp. WL0002]
MTIEKPLVLDVDGTFLRTDMLYENFWAGLGAAPVKTLVACVRHIRNPAMLKAELARIAPIRTDLLPVNPEIAELALQCRLGGREVVLASASDNTQVARLSADYGLSEHVFASDGVSNLKGGAKAQALVEAYGEGGFDYAGNSSVDMPIWEKAENALVVGHVPSARALAADGRNVVEFPGGWELRALFKAMRPHQWVKNVLLLLPLLASHRFEMATLVPILWGMAAFSLAASAIYICNDLLDLEADRLHPTKCRRPFASGEVPISVGMVAMAALSAGALLIAIGLSAGFLLVTLLYMALSLAYSLKLKRMRWVDVTMLAALYTIRVVAGASAAAVEVSIYMLIFIFPIFLTLGCVKRITELSKANGDERLPGRGYGRGELADLRNVAGIGIVGALVIFLLYSVSDQGLSLYPTTWLLWLAMVPMAVWMVRMVNLAWHGRQDYDPIVFALRDPLGLGLLMLILSLMFWAAGLWQQWFG